MNEWKNCTLSEVIKLIGGGTPKTTISDYWNGNIPWLSVVDFNDDNRKVYKAEKHITELGLCNSSTKLLETNDIIVSARGTVGAIAQLGRPMAFNQSCYGIKSRENIDIDFLYYLLKTKINELKQKSHGSVFSTITRDTFDNIEIELPPIEIQKQIAKVLSSIDDKIELNNKINDNLEQQAQAIFEQLFGEAIADIDNNNNTSLDSLVRSIDNRGKTPPLSQTNTDFPIIDVKALAGKSRIINFNNCSKYVDEQTYNEWFRNGHPMPLDILISTVGSLAEMKLFYGSTGCIAQNVVGFRSKGISPFYLYQYLQHIKNDLVSYNIGSVQPSIKVTHIMKHKILLPTNEGLQTFDVLAKSLSDEIYKNCIEIDRLSQLRDTLLPKLMSGEIDVSEVEI